MRYDVLTRIGEDSWENVWRENDKLRYFPTHHEAQVAIDQHINDMASAYMSCDQDDFKIAEVEVHGYLAVIGRVHGNDEDDVFLYQGLTIEEARRAFREDQIDAVADAGRDPVGDTEIYISYVLVSESPILIEERNV